MASCGPQHQCPTTKQRGSQPAWLLRPMGGCGHSRQCPAGTLLLGASLPTLWVVVGPAMNAPPVLCTPVQPLPALGQPVIDQLVALLVLLARAGKVSRPFQLHSSRGRCTLSSMHWKLRQGLVDLIRWLASRGAALQPTDHGGRTPTHEAARGGQVEALKVGSHLKKPTRPAGPAACRAHPSADRSQGVTLKGRGVTPRQGHSQGHAAHSATDRGGAGGGGGRPVGPPPGHGLFSGKAKKVQLQLKRQAKRQQAGQGWGSSDEGSSLCGAGQGGGGPSPPPLQQGPRAAAVGAGHCCGSHVLVVGGAGGRGRRQAGGRPAGGAGQGQPGGGSGGVCLPGRAAWGALAGRCDAIGNRIMQSLY
ncbi:hypothetical protein HaLaN_12131 [Haematococcus lacustris]|uniref:Uncharacterized protein n=1 Tax=Haematococcus lacustris TaxID=44745 RepID=A0A699Z2P6_HAELA|nr:hypothetical protein HaLaN_12131 [Haematococcus lacustris]